MKDHKLPDWLQATVGPAIAHMNKDAIRNPCGPCRGFTSYSPWPKEYGVGRVLVRVIATITHAEDCVVLGQLRDAGLADIKPITGYPGCYMRHIGTEQFVEEFVATIT